MGGCGDGVLPGLLPAAVFTAPPPWLLRASAPHAWYSNDSTGLHAIVTPPLISSALRLASCAFSIIAYFTCAAAFLVLPPARAVLPFFRTPLSQTSSPSL
ncbi:hypothetical protein GOP47_0009736 [Adiantum capillus-veneris]|uniref:Uncharacterized protein n=1 Tax=Adiantum capillus-veneris TaxID=13818 RepID=A0A9D4UWU0_ADICA|nr:hypothetical protein GOP47_0009736 [Adiantum capillus-veneris]